MNLKSIVAVIVAVLAGTIGGAAAYTVATPSSASGPAPTSTSIQPAAETQDVAAPVEKVVKLRPCRKPAELVGKKCVTDVTRTVVLPGSARSSAPAAGTSVPGDDPTDDDGTDDQGDDQGGVPGTGSDDQGDDDQYDDQGDDSGDDEADDQSDDQDEPGDDDSDETESPEVED
jgi:hypothetical protein